MIKKQFYFILLLTIGITVFSTSCKSNKYTVVNTDGSVSSKNNQEIVSDVLDAELKYETISTKASLEVAFGNASSGMKTNAYIKLIRDKELQVSIRIPFINSEAFRVNVTPDSIYIIDRVGKQYAIESIRKYQEQHNVNLNFYNLQAVLTDCLFIPGKEKLTKKDYDKFTITMANGLFYLETKDQLNTKYSFAVNAKDRIEAILAYNKDYNFNIEWKYNNYIEDLGSNIYPTDIKTSMNVGGKNVKLNISYSTLDINTKIEIDKQMPNKYKKSTISNILKSYIK